MTIVKLWQAMYRNSVSKPYAELCDGQEHTYIVICHNSEAVAVVKL